MVQHTLLGSTSSLVCSMACLKAKGSDVITFPPCNTNLRYSLVSSVTPVADNYSSIY